jgi:crotonobetainyl-CoA:carnitine CoA-transferase CaiB-like acyl-CoA transferase
MAGSSGFGADAHSAIRALLEEIGLEGEALASMECTLRFSGDAPAFDSPHRLVLAAAAALGAQALAVEAWWRHCGGRPQRLEMDLLQAAAALCPLRYQRQHGHPMQALTGLELKQDFCQTSDGRWFYPIGPYPHLRNGVLDLLGTPNNLDAIARAISLRTGDELESAFAAAGLPGACVRTRQEWREHPQGALLGSLPTIHLQRLDDSPTRRPAGLGPRPLSGVRVLDAAHVIAGPVAARTLAEHGAEVLRVGAPYQPDPTMQIMDTGIGKRTAFVDLKTAAGAATMRALCADADVFVQSWKAGALARLGFGPAELARMRPGIIYVSVSAYGHVGPWAGRGGFEQVGQIVSGIAAREGDGGKPRIVPTFLLNDYLSGYLAAAGVAAALLRRSVEGGSWHVNVSLTRTSMWVQDLGLVDRPAHPVDPATLQPRLVRRDSPFGVLEQLGPVVQFSRTPARWDSPPAPLGAHRAQWMADIADQPVAGVA